MPMVRAIYSDGVFRPTKPVDLPERTEVEFEPRAVPPADRPTPPADASSEVLDVLSRRYASGQRDVAARHNEHQP